MTIEDLRTNGLIVLECISGSKAYGLDTPLSDTDIKGVFMLPMEHYYGLNYIPQISNETNDVVFYEFKRFMELLSVNNPNILELLNTPEESVIFKHPCMNAVRSDLILSKLCRDTFGKFALSQIKKAKGLKKKIVNPVAEERKSILEFSYVNYNQGSIPLQTYLSLKNWNQEDCGLVKLPNMANVYGLYHEAKGNYRGIISGPDSNDVSLSSVPPNAQQEAILYVNFNGYSTYCREYREYWDWVKKRNEQRYQNTQSHGKKYDAKNMMHVFRLLEMAIEIGVDGVVNVRRSNRDFLLEIKSGTYDFNELIDLAEERQKELEVAFEHSSLPESPDLDAINNLAFSVRNNFYSGNW